MHHSPSRLWARGGVFVCGGGRAMREGGKNHLVCENLTAQRTMVL